MAFHRRQIANSEGDADRLVVRVESVEADQLPRANCPLVVLVLRVTRGRPSSQGCAVTKRRNAVCMHVAKPARHPARANRTSCTYAARATTDRACNSAANLPTYFTQSTSPVLLSLPEQASLLHPSRTRRRRRRRRRPSPPTAVATAAPSAIDDPTTSCTRLTCPATTTNDDDDDDIKNKNIQYTVPKHPIVYASTPDYNTQHQLPSPNP